MNVFEDRNRLLEHLENTPDHPEDMFFLALHDREEFHRLLREIEQANKQQ